MGRLLEAGCPVAAVEMVSDLPVKANWKIRNHLKHNIINYNLPSLSSIRYAIAWSHRPRPG